MGSFHVSRATTIAADAATVHALIDDFHAWTAWSPWEGLDPSMERTYSGEESGVGAHYAWSGNRRAGSGTMTIIGSTPHQVDVTLTFLTPMASVNDVTFELTTHAGATTVVWGMSGVQRGVMGLVGKVISMDRIVGKDFEKGLARLKAAAEA